MNGRIAGGFIVISALIAGAAMYYLQVYGFYEEIDHAPDDLHLIGLVSGAPEPILVDGFSGIDADSSPLRFRGCFTTPMSLAMLSETYVIHPDPVPLTAPGWFDCFDAPAIGAALASGEALAFTGQENIEYGVDRVIAVYRDGRAFAWHQLNNCGQRRYDGTDVGPACPPRDGGN